MSTSEKIFKIGATIATIIFIMLGIAITISAWLVPNWVIELRIVATIFGSGFLAVPNILILYMVWEG